MTIAASYAHVISCASFTASFWQAESMEKSAVNHVTVMSHLMTTNNLLYDCRGTDVNTLESFDVSLNDHITSQWSCWPQLWH